MMPPIKPFAGYKWRWASYQPSEGLNDPPVYLGILRILERHEGESKNSPEVTNELALLQSQLETAIDLARDPASGRNLFRNSGQYWQGLGLLQKSVGKIHLTDWGRRVASGSVTTDEFAITTAKTLTLPNRFLEPNPTEWDRVGLEIKPLELILKILLSLAEGFSSREAYITALELTRIIIPLAGTKANIDEYIASIRLSRDGQLNVSGWVDCTPAANDKRMAREFLLFLSHYGLCKCTFPGFDRMTERYSLTDPELIRDLLELEVEVNLAEQVVQEIRFSDLATTVQRKRVVREIWERPNQSRFRRDVLSAYQQTCLLTGESLPEVLEAAHIKPVKYQGSDFPENGICLRVDIHHLFDAGHLRITPNGDIMWSEVAAQSPTYSALPTNIQIPSFVSQDLIEWRFNYC